MVDPGLESHAIEALDQGPEIPRRAADAVDEEHRNAVRIVGLEEEDAATDLAHRTQRRPHAGFGLLLGEARMVEAHNFAGGDRHRVEGGLLQAAEIDLEGRWIILGMELELTLLEVFSGLGDDRIRAAVDRRRLSRVGYQVAVVVLEGDHQVGLLSLEDEGVAADDRGQPVGVLERQAALCLAKERDHDVLGAAARRRHLPREQAQPLGFRQLPVQVRHRAAGGRQQHGCGQQECIGAKPLHLRPFSSENSPQTAKPASVAGEPKTRLKRQAFGFHRQNFAFAGLRIEYRGRPS